MKNIFSFSLLIILFIYIINDTNVESNNSLDTFQFKNISNIKCNTNNYTSSFSLNICGETSIKSSQYLGFSFYDTKNVSHSVKCSIIIEPSSRKLESMDTSYEDDYDSEIESDIDNTEIYNTIETNEEIEKQSDLENTTYKEELRTEYIVSDSYKDELSTDINSINDASDIVEKNTYDTNRVISTTIIETDVKSSAPTNIINPTTEVEVTIPKTYIETTAIEIRTTISTTYIEPTITIENTIQETVSETSSIPITNITDITTIEQNEIVIINNSTNSSDFCYEAICTFKGMIREEFEVIVENNFSIFLEEIPKDIFIYPIFFDILKYKVDKCYLIKNIFKQVLKFKKYISQKKLTFIFVSIILGKVEKNEEINVTIFLKKKDRSIRNLEILEENNARCKSKYNVEPIQGKDVLNTYNCEVNNIENPNEYSGLIFNSSLDVKNITKDENMSDPAITDEYIKQGRIRDYSLREFNPTSLDINDCNKTSKFNILGNLDKELDNELVFELLLYLNDNANENVRVNCSIPSGIKGEISFPCQAQEYFYNSTILIPLHLIFDPSSNESILNITEIRDNKEVTCEVEEIKTEEIIEIIPTLPETEIINTIPDTIPETIPETIPAIVTTPDIYIIPEKINTDIVFRQISHLEKNYEENIISFNLIGFTFNSLNYNSYIIIPINLIKIDKNTEEKNATCTLNKTINANINKLNPIIFDCQVYDIDEIANLNDIEILPFSLIKNIPKGYSKLVYAKITDDLIKEGELLDYKEEKNFNNIPPFITNSYIISSKCNVDGSFEIISFIDKEIEKNISFYLELKEPKIEVRCKIPETEGNKNVIIKCNTMESFQNKLIEIESEIAYDIDNNELFYINYTKSLNYYNCKNNDELTIIMAEKKIKANFTFRQASKFKKNNNKYTFFLATFIKGNIAPNSKISLKAILKSETNNLNYLNKKKLNNKRKLSRTEEQNVECTILSQTNINENGVGAAGWDCSTGESSIEDATGIEIVESEDISGIPDDPTLIDPAKTDELIKKGEIKDYSIEENLNELLPIFNTLSLNYSLCRQNGSFYFKGNLSSTIHKDIIFNLTLSYPDSVFACRLPRTLKGQITEIECFNRDNFENSTIIVEETVIRDGFNEYFIFRNISSGDLIITCTSSQSKAMEKKYEEDFKVISKRINEDSSGGLGTTGIIIIIVICAVVFLAIIMLTIFIKRKNRKKNLENNDRKMVNSSGSSIASSSSSSYY